MKNLLSLIFTLFFYCVAFTQNSNQNFTINVSVPLYVNVTDITTNQDKTFDNSKNHFFKYQQVLATFKNITISKNRFSGTYVSDLAFVNRDMITMSGEFSADRKMIKWLTLESTHHMPSNYSGLLWSIETVKFNVSLQDIPLTYGNKYSLDKGTLKSVDYESKKFISRSHNRTEKYEEQYEMTAISNEKHLSGYVDIDNCIEKPLKTITIGFLNDNEEFSKRLQLDLVEILSFQVESGNILLIERSEKAIAAIEQEVSLTEAGLVSSDKSIQAETAKSNLLKETDLTVYIQTNTNTANPELIDFRVELNTATNKQEFKKSFLNNENLSRESFGFAAIIMSTIRKIQEGKL